MKTLPVQLRILVLAIAGWLYRHPQDAVDQVRERNRFLRAKLGVGRLRVTDLERRLFTILAWHRKLVARKWTFPTGRDGNAEEI